MHYYKAVYIAAIFLAGIGSVVASFLNPGDELLIISLGQVVLAVLTFPLGFIAAAIGSALIFLGIVTPTEAFFIATPIFAVLGYIQWWRLLSVLYRSRP